MDHGLDYIFTYGKYKGLTIRAVLRFNPQYILWLRNSNKDFGLTKEAFSIYKEAIIKYRSFMLMQQDAWAHGFGLQAKQARTNYDRKMAQIEQEERTKADNKWKIPYE